MSGVPGAPDWPLLEYAICWSAGPNDAPAGDSYNWYDATSRTEGSWSSQRGKQYELDQVQPGEIDGLTLRNDDGVFDPANAASPFWPMVLPYRLMRIRAQYPGTINRLTAAQATAVIVGESSLDGMAVEPGVTYTVSCQASQAGGSTGNSWQIQWLDVAGNIIATHSGPLFTIPATGSIVVSFTDTAPADAVGISTIFLTHATASSTQFQFERSSSASPFVTPGTWYELFTGYVERWPQQWESGGSYGTVALTLVDLFSFLANRGLNWAAYLQVLVTLGSALVSVDSPTFFYPLDDAAGATSFHDASGNRAPATIMSPKAGVAGTLAAGSDLAGTLPLGIPGPAVSATAKSGQTVTQVIDLTGGGANPAGPGIAGGAWTRIIAFQTPTTAALAGTTGAYLWSVQQPTNGRSITVTGSYDGSGNFGSLQVLIDAGAGTGLATSAANLSDNAWHLLVVGAEGGSLPAWKVWLDGVLIGSGTDNLTQPWSAPATADVIAGSATPADGPVSPGAAGQYAFVAELPYLIGSFASTSPDDLWQAFQDAFGTDGARVETSGDRYSRILGWLGQSTSLSRVDTGALLTYGPAIDIQGGDTPTAALDALQAVVDSEVGQHFIATDGAVVFQARTDRFNQTPALTFGENTAGGEIPYTGTPVVDFDPTLVLNAITGSTPSGAQVEASTVVASDATSAAQYGTITAQRTVNTTDGNVLAETAGGVLYQNRQPLPRLETITVDVGANPSLFASLLGVELGTCVAVKRRPSNAPAITINGFVEQIVWSFADDRTCTWAAQISNNAFHQFGEFNDAVLGKFDSTLIFGF